MLALVADVARAYVELRDLDRRLEISRRTLESRARVRRARRDRFEGGRDLRARLAPGRGRAAPHGLAGARLRAAQVTQKENELSRPARPQPRRDPARHAAGRDRRAAGRPGRPALRRCSSGGPTCARPRSELASANARIGEAKALLYPSIALTGAFGWESTELDDLFESPSQSWSIGANLLQPIFNAGQNRRRVEVAESQQRQALYAYERSILHAFREVEDCARRAAPVRPAARLRGRARRRPSARCSSWPSCATAAAWPTYLEVLDAQRSLFDAELDETQRDPRRARRADPALQGARRRLAAGEPGRGGRGREPASEEPDTKAKERRPARRRRTRKPSRRKTARTARA